MPSVPPGVEMNASSSSAVAAATPKSSVRMALTFSAPIFSSLSIVRITSPAFSVRPRMAKKPFNTLRLLMRILKRSSPSEVKVL